MDKNPAFLLYPGDHLRETMGFTFEMHGAFLLALIFQFDHGPFTEIQISGLLGDKFQLIKSAFKNDGNLFWNERLSNTIKKRDKYSASRSKNIASRWDKKDKPLSNKKIDSIHMNNICNTHVIHMENENRIEIKNRNLIPPSFEDVKKYCDERKNSINPQKFIDHYSSNGWMVGKNKMKNWQAAIRTWEGNSFENPCNVSPYEKLN
jgi:hypothetical protein